MACDQTNSTGIGAKCDRCFDGASIAAASGCRPGLPAWPRHEAKPHQIISTQTPARNGNSATAASPTTGHDEFVDHEYRRTVFWCIAIATAVLWVGIAVLVRSCT